MRVEIVSPESVLYEGEGEMVVCRTVSGGDVAFLEGHAPFIATLQIGEVRVLGAGGAPLATATVHRGFVEVSHDRVTVLSDVAELLE